MTWNIEPTHSSIDFTVRHMGFSNVRGRFENFSANLETDADNKPVSATVTIDASSINTNVEDRDNHLRSADFFDVENHPNITFQSTSITDLGGNNYRVDGDLTIRGTTNPFSIELETSGEAVKSPFGMMVAAANGAGSLNRKDYGLTWNQVLEAGGVLVSDTVKFSFDFELIQAD